MLLMLLTYLVVLLVEIFEINMLNKNLILEIYVKLIILSLLKSKSSALHTSIILYLGSIYFTKIFFYIF